MLTRRRGGVGFRSFRARLGVELLEDRRLLDAGGLSGVFDPTRILVGDVSGQVRQVELAAGVSVSEAVREYQGRPGVAFAEPDYVVSAGLTPNDTYFNLEYGLHNTGQTIGGSVGIPDADIDAPEAWDITTGSSTTVVSVIDTGIDYRHPDLYLNIWINQDEIPSAIRSALTDIDGDGLITFWDLNNAANQGTGKITDLNANGRIDGGDLLNNTSGWENGADNDADGRIDDLIGWDFVNNDNDPLDDHGHGTHVAGTIGAVTNNAVGVAGVNWRVQMAAMKFLSAQGSGAISGALNALNLSVANGIKISNNSWGGGGFSQSFFDALVTANNAGHVFVAAAGNNNRNNDVTAFYPANYNVANVLSVGATNNRDVRASFSNYGVNTVDIAAPGVNIASTYPNNGYAYLSGTSMASPHAAGVVALVRTQSPTLTVAETIGRILSGADVIPGLQSTFAGGRRLNAFKSLEAPPSDSDGPTITSAAPNGTSSVSAVRLTFSEAIKATTFTAADITDFGSLTSIGVTQVSSTQFDVTFDAVTTAGTYSFTVGPNITDLANNAMDQNGNGTSGESGDTYIATFTVSETFTFTNDTDVFITDRSTVTSTITINQDMNITDLNVRVNLTHTWDSDLIITLRSPGGVTMTLSNRRGGSGDNYTNTLFDDEAANPISSGAAPFAGTFRPEGSLGVYDDTSALGAWTLSIQDAAQFDVGTLLSWSLIVTTNGGGGGASSFDGPGDFVPVAPSGPVSSGLSSERAQGLTSSDPAAGILLGGTAESSELRVSESRIESSPTRPDRLPFDLGKHTRKANTLALDAVFAKRGPKKAPAPALADALEPEWTRAQ